MSTRLDDDKKILKLYQDDKANHKDDANIMQHLVSFIANNDLDNDNVELSVILDMAVEYCDESTDDNRRNLLWNAVSAIIMTF